MANAILLASAAILGASLSVSDVPRSETRASVPPRFYGVNLASAEFAPDKLPGLHGTDYIYPTKATAAPFIAMGMNSVRLPVLWERLQPVAGGPLDKDEVERLDAALVQLGEFEQIILDVHNYARFRGRKLSTTDRSSDALGDLWRRLALRYKDQKRLAFGIMNEPHDISAIEWRSIAQATVAAIRQTGAKNLVLVPGTRWTGGHSWHVGGRESNSEALDGFVDPGRNFAFEVHQYLDADSSGSGKTCSSVQSGRQRLERVTKWMRARNDRAVLGEFGVGQSPKCLAALDDLLAFLKDNGDVWIGWNYWAGGDWWGDYPLSAQPVGDTQKPQAAVLRRHILTYTTR